MQCNATNYLKTRFSVVLTDDDVAQFVMQGVMQKIGMVDRRAVARIQNGDLRSVEVELVVTMEEAMGLDRQAF